MLTREILDQLDDADVAAFLHRQKWLASANAPARGGKQLPPTDLDWQILLYVCGRGFGKQVSLETILPTPSGWVKNGDLKRGDELFDENGNVCRVTHLHRIEVAPRSFRVSFSDHTHIDACGDHLWVTWVHRDRKQAFRDTQENDFPEDWVKHRVPLRDAGGNTKGSCGPTVKTTDEIRRTLTHGVRGDLNHCIPIARPLRLPDARLICDPYVVGYFLGNGTSKTGALTTGSHEGNFDDTEIIKALERVGYNDLRTNREAEYGRSSIASTSLRQDIKAIGLLDAKKHIPQDYLRASISQRMELLRGLCDSDGHVNQKGYIEFCSTSPILARQTLELIRSLGERPVMQEDRAKLNGVDCGPRFRITWRWSYGEKPFRLKRKADRLVPLGAQGLRLRHRMITSVEPISPVPMRCITVDSPNHMYLVGEGMIPTHNTQSESEFLFWEGWRVPNLVLHYIAPTLSDVRGTIFEGPAGLCSVIPAECLKGGTLDKAYNKSTHELRLSNGTLFRGFGAVEEAGRLRGPQCHALACDELREWDRPAGNLELALSNALLGLRLPYPDGTPSRAVMGTTPKPIPYLKRLEKRPGVRVVRGTSRENLANLSDSFRYQLLSMDGTLLGRQEIDGAYIDEESDLSILKRHWIKLWPAYVDKERTVPRKLPDFQFVLEVYDTATSEENFDVKKQQTDPSGSIVLGVFNVHQHFDETTRRKMGVRGRYAALLLDAWNERLGFPELLEKARMQHRIKWGSKPGKRSDIVLIEDKSSGPSLRQMLSTWGVPCWPYNPKRESKAMRLHAASPLIKQGMLWVPESGRPDRAGLPRDWVEPFLEQICAFAGEGSVEHDEMVDCISSGIAYLRDRNILTATPEEIYADYEERRDAERAEAVRLHQEERAEQMGNPYD